MQKSRVLNISLKGSLCSPTYHGDQENDDEMSFTLQFLWVGMSTCMDNVGLIVNCIVVI